MPSWESCLTQCVTFCFEVQRIKNTNDINMSFNQKQEI